MDIGIIVIHHSIATVSRCDDSPNGLILIPATNAEALQTRAAAWLTCQDIDLHNDGIYLCSDQLQIAADFPPLLIPGDLIPFSDARHILYPHVNPSTGRQQIWRDVEAKHLQIYRIGIAENISQYLSRQQVEALAASRQEAMPTI